MKTPARIARITLLLGITLFLGACATGQPITGSTQDSKPGTESSNALSISDIPIPPGAKLDTENSLIMGAQDRWLGRLVIRTDSSPTQSFNYFYSGMPALGWGTLTAVQARISSMAYLRGDRVASIQIEATALGGSNISITVSPRQTGNQEPVRQKQP